MRQIGKVLKFILLTANLCMAGLMLLAAYSPLLQPAHHPWLSSMGLTFPLFLILNGLFLIFWLIVQQYKLSLLPLLTLLICYNDIHTLFPLNLWRSDPPEKHISLLSYNIMAFHGCQKGEEGNPILNYLKTSGADILCLQEYATGRDHKRHLMQADIDRALKAYPYHTITAIGEGKRRTNKIACYSKYPIISSRKVDYPSPYNGSAIYRILVDGDTLTVINNHLESNKLTKEDKVVYEELLSVPEKEKMNSVMRHLIKKLAEASVVRGVQADSLARRIEAIKGKPIVVCGDFNDIPLSYAYRQIARCQLTDAFAHSGRGAGISYNQHHFYFRIDHILTGGGVTSYNCRVDRSIKTSDHYPIRCDLTLPLWNQSTQQKEKNKS